MPEQGRDEKVPSWGLLAINAAYNRGEFTFEQWMKLSREWAEAMIRQFGTDEQKRHYLPEMKEST